MWTNHGGGKQTHYIKELNPTYDHGHKSYLIVDIKGKQMFLVAMTSSHHLKCENRRWMVPKEV